jgi:leucyl-tRNA synthetase
MEYNTAISAMMIFLNDAQNWTARPKSALATFLQLLAPFAPHIAEELWAALGREPSISRAPWPKWDENVLRDDEIELPIQVNGKLRARVRVPADAPKDAVLAAARTVPDLVPYLDGKTIRKEILVPGRMVNLVVS